jgi:molecular chaperone HscB
MTENDFKKNYFELLSLEASFEIDVVLLRDRMRALQMRFHPDRFVNASPQERRLSVQYAALINEAFDVLRSPVSRAAYLLQLKSIDVEFEKNVVFDPEFLMQQMQWREALEKARAKGDTSLAKTVDDDLHKTMQVMLSQLTELFKNDDENSLMQAKSITRKLKFCLKMQEKLN